MNKYTIVLFALAAAFVASLAGARDGVPAAGFGANGRSYLYWGRTSPAVDYSTASAVGADGSVLLVGNIGDTEFGCASNPVSIGIARLRSDGHFDASFGDAATPGQTVIHAGCNHRFAASAVAIDAAGKILIVGNDAFLGMQYIGVWRLNANGAPDATFGSGGRARLARSSGLQPYDAAGALSVGADGNIAVFGSAQDASGRRDCATFKLYPNGALLPFGNTVEANGVRYFRTTVLHNGVPATQCHLAAAVPFGANFHFYESVGAGYLLEPGGAQRAVLIALDGTLAPSADFGTGGIVTFNFDDFFGQDRPSTVNALLADRTHARLWAAGSAGAQGGVAHDDMALAAFDADGNFDTGVLAGGGYALYDVSVGSRVGHAYAVGVVQQRDGALVLGGAFHFDGFHDDAYLAALRLFAESGAADPSFGDFSAALPGVAALQVPIGGASAETRATSLHLANGGTIVLGGYTHDYNVPGSYYYAAVEFSGDAIFADGFQ